IVLLLTCGIGMPMSVRSAQAHPDAPVSDSIQKKKVSSAKSVQAQQGRPQTPEGAQQQARPAPTETPKGEWSVTEHTIRIGTQTIPYKASAGTTLLKNDAGEPTGLLYTVAYTRSDVKDPSTRPVAFLYNGGPGSASMWLHMGAFGPRRVWTVDGEFTPPAPYKLVDNAESLLD